MYYKQVINFSKLLDLLKFVPLFYYFTDICIHYQTHYTVAIVVTLTTVTLYCFSPLTS